MCYSPDAAGLYVGMVSFILKRHIFQTFIDHILFPVVSWSRKRVKLSES